MGPIQSIKPAIKAPITCYEARMLIKVDKSKQKYSSLIQYGAIQKNLLSLVTICRTN